MRLKILMVAAVLASAGLAARADSLTETYTFNGTGTFNNSLGAFDITSSSFNLFNPSLGTLDSMNFAFSGDVTVSGGGGGGATLTALTPASNPQTDLFNESQPFLSGTTPISFDQTLAAAPNDLAIYFEGTGTQGLALKYVNVGLYGASLAADNIQGTVTYNYTPAAAVTPEPGTWMLLGTGLLALVAMRRRMLA